MSTRQTAGGVLQCGLNPSATEPRRGVDGSVAAADVPLCVDCDGTLIRTDLLHESVLGLLKRSPGRAFMLPFWFLKGKADAKDRLSRIVELDPRLLPYNEALLEWLRAEKASGRVLILATASPDQQARAVAEYLQIFDAVEATRDGVNLKGSRKADRLVARFGEQGFDYAGNDAADVPVWKVARQGVVVSRKRRVLGAAAAATQVSRVFDTPRAGVFEHLKALRLHQWLKNVLIFLPLLAAQKLNDAALLLDGVLAFLAFSLCASSVYIVNDLLDLPSDRAHITKRVRPFASGQISILHGVLMVPVLLAGAAVLGARLNPLYQLSLLGYLLLTTTYSLWLKSQVIVDVLLLATLYTSRVIAGAAATFVRPSFWLLAFSMFMFLSLAIVKRYSEMLVVLKRSASRAVGRGYKIEDLPVLMALGTASGYCAVMVLALYINSSDVSAMYSNREVLWLVLPLVLYWISRVWMKTHRGEMNDDPVVFAARDWQSLVISGLLVSILAAAV